MQRWLLRAAVALAIVVVLAVAGVYVFLRRSLPQTGGTIVVSGISAPVDIVRDADSITHVFGATKLDAFFGLGYAHAQDRLWQMEFQRRVGMGRLSEVFGPTTLNTDRFLRTLGTGRAARLAWDSLPQDTKTQLNAYVAGVNAFIATHHGSQLPLEFTLLRFEPEPWSGPDVLAWVKMMAWDLSKNYSFELLRHDVTALLGPAGAAMLFPPYPENGLTILNKGDTQQTRVTAEDAKDAETHFQRSSASSASSAVHSFWSSAFASALQLPSFGSALGSNNWVADGTMTASGKPLLANDPHLDAQIPSLWYLAHLSAGDFDVIGATLPGAPVVVLGRNRFIAWGATNTAADVQDLYRERLDSTGRFTEFEGRAEPIRFVQELIRVKGVARPLPLLVRVTRHGPLISDALNANNATSAVLSERKRFIEPLAFRWTALDSNDTTVTSMLRVNEARNWDEFTAALRDFVVPAQNFVYADVNGHIGYYAPGHYPIRAHGNGEDVAVGWTGDQEWTGWVPFENLPHVYDPPEHFIVTANNKPTPAGSEPAITGEFTDPYRAQRITDRLRQTPKLTPDDYASIQADTYSLHAKQLLPILLERVHPKDPKDTQAIQILREWNFDARGDSPATAIFQAWYYELPIAVLGDKLGGQLLTDYLALERNSYRSRFLMKTLAAKDNAWCNNVRKPQEKQNCDDVALLALHAAVERLARSLGDDMRAWRWDSIHRAIFAHPTFNTLPIIGRWLRREAGHGGDWSTVDVGPVFAPRPFEQHSVPGYREIIDLSPANDSRFIEAVGQSGHPLSPHYDDALPLWANHKYRKMRMERADIERDALGQLQLVPR